MSSPQRTRRILLVALSAVILFALVFTVDSLLNGYTGLFGGIRRGLARAEPKGDITWQVVGRGFREVTDIQFVPGLPNTAVVLQKDGVARVVTFGKGEVTADKSPKLLEVKVRTASELGLLGLAFSPSYGKDGLFYLNYTPAGGKTRNTIAEWRLVKDKLGKAQAREVRVLLEVEQPFPNHNAGQLAFGPDGMLYIGMGDGGKRADPFGHGQDLGTLLGSMLRIDVRRKDPGLGYGIPKDNPFVGKEGARPEIWAYGLRNPWRYSFDPKGRLIVADVGQDAYEEVDIVTRGANLGWAVREASHCFPPGASCTKKGLLDPIFEYGRTQGISITGGYVYLGSSLPELKGTYIFGDFGSGRIWALSLPKSATGAGKAKELGRWPRSIASFGRDGQGEIYAGDYASGELLKLSR